ncbi:hypothetical protein FRB95_011527 [Tulasnella sp. JGI-2019a]|nr:hypothetical protein FRB95_011527 [Tulasnella sp. JGI-2019a]
MDTLLSAPTGHAMIIIIIIKTSVAGVHARCPFPNDYHLQPSNMSTMRPASKQNDSYEFPELVYQPQAAVASALQAKVNMLQAAAVVTALLAGIAAQMISVEKSGSGDKDSGSIHYWRNQLMVFTSYAALFLTIGSTFASFLLIGRLNSDADACQNDTRALQDLVSGKSCSRLARIIEWHRALIHAFCEVTSVLKTFPFIDLVTLFGGGIAILIQLITYIWIHEGYVVAILSSVVAAFSAASAMLHWIENMKKKRERISRA